MAFFTQRQVLAPAAEAANLTASALKNERATAALNEFIRRREAIAESPSPKSNAALELSWCHWHEP